MAHCPVVADAGLIEAVFCNTPNAALSLSYASRAKLAGQDRLVKKDNNPFNSLGVEHCLV